MDQPASPWGYCGTATKIASIALQIDVAQTSNQHSGRSIPSSTQAGEGTIMDATTTAHQGRALWLSTIAFTICFAVWTIFSIIGIRIKQELGLNDTQFGLLVGTPILSGSLIRLVARHLDRSVWRSAGLHRRHAVRGGRNLPADLGDYVSRISGGCVRSSVSPAARSRSASPTSRDFIPRASRAPRSASSAPATSALPSPNSSRPSCWWPMAGRPSPRSGRWPLA